VSGIAGFNWQDKPLIRRMSEVIRHRGADDEGYYVDNTVSLCHRHLSISDSFEKGCRPLELKNLVLAYDGRIYNLKELRARLVSEGYHFSLSSEDEVVIYSYHLWGPSCVDKFNGMWAFCIYDKDKKSLFLSRDRFGIKPLYYYFDGSRFIFASELKAFKEHELDFNISLSALNFFFYQCCVGYHFTIFENCYKLQPSYNITFNISKKELSRTRYYSLEHEIYKCQRIPIKQRLESIEDLCVDAVKKRLIGGGTVGALVSGGVDSSLVAAIASQNHKDLHLFSVVFKEKKYDELSYAELVARHIQKSLHYDYFELDDNVLKFIVENMDEPFGDRAVVTQYLLEHIASRGMIKVYLSGDGGDHVFAGHELYRGYKVVRYMPRIARRLLRCLIGRLSPFVRDKSLVSKLQIFIKDVDNNGVRRHLNWLAPYTDFERQELLGKYFVNTDSFINFSLKNNLLALQLNDMCIHFEAMVQKKVDIGSSLNSLEVRTPYLDYRLVPLALSLPERYKVRGLETKWILKKIASKYLPKEIVYRKKRGMGGPIAEWIKQGGLIEEFISSRRYYRHNYINYNYTQQLFNEHVTNQKDNAAKLWLIFIFNYWWYYNMDGFSGSY